MPPRNPLRLDADLALVVDNAALPARSLEAVSELFGNLLGRLQPAQRGARVALVLTGPTAPQQGLGEVDLGLQSPGEQLRERLRLALVPRVAAAAPGGAVAWALRHVFPGGTRGRLRVLFVVGTGNGALWDGEARQALVPFSRCRDFGVLVLSLGRDGTERPEAAVPEVLAGWRHHELRLGSVQGPELGYAERMALGFLRSLWGEPCWGLEHPRVVPPAAPGGAGFPGGSLVPQTFFFLLFFPAPPSFFCHLLCVAAESSRHPSTPGCPQGPSPSGADTTEPSPGTPAQ